jgi:hypothetical protein
MSTSEFPEPGQANSSQTRQMQSGPAAGVTAETAAYRARTVDLHNPRFLCWTAMVCGILSVPLGMCMMLEGGSLLFPVRAITFRLAIAAGQWILGGFLMCMTCPWAWQWGTRMLGLHVKLDARGVDFNLGTKKKPGELFMAWEQVAAVQQKRVGQVREYTVLGKDGSRASFTSNTLFRSQRIARMIAERAGLTIQKV